MQKYLKIFSFPSRPLKNIDARPWAGPTCFLRADFLLHFVVVHKVERDESEAFK
jgi:hypothetical protein